MANVQRSVLAAKSRPNQGQTEPNQPVLPRFPSERGLLARSPSSSFSRSIPREAPRTTEAVTTTTPEAPRTTEAVTTTTPEAPRTTEARPEQSRKTVTTTTHDSDDFFALSDAFYQMQWQPLSLLPAPNKTNKTSPGHWFILSDRQGIGQQLSVLLEAQGQTTTVLGSSTSQHFDKLSAKQLKRQLSALLEATESPCRGIVYFAGTNQLPPDLLMSQRLASEVEHQLGTVLALIQTLAKVKEKPAPRLWLVTQAAQPVQHTHPLAVAQVPLWGMGRTCAIEQPDLWGGLVDLDPNARHDESAQQLLQTLLASDGENQVAFRQNTRYVARLVPVEAPQAPQAAPLVLQPDASYLVTGGLKGLGYEVSRWLAQKGAQHLILLGRTPLSESSLLANRIAELEELGTSVHYAPVDITDARQMHTFFNALRQSNDPPIRGVVHCASVWKDQNGHILVRPLLQLDKTALSAVLQPKVLGTLHLAQHITDKLDFFTCFSSGASLIGSAAQSNYAAANAFLNGMAHYLSALGQPATSINWGAISDIGFGGTPEGQKLHEFWENQGIGRISPSHMLATLERLHAHNVPQIAVMNIDWPLLFRAHPDLARMAWARDVLKVQQPLNFAVQAPSSAKMKDESSQKIEVNATQTKPRGLPVSETGSPLGQVSAQRTIIEQIPEDEAAKPVLPPVLPKAERKIIPLPAHMEDKKVKLVQEAVRLKPKAAPISVSNDSALVQLMNQQLEVMSQQMSLQSKMVAQQMELMSKQLELLQGHHLSDMGQNGKKKARL